MGAPVAETVAERTGAIQNPSQRQVVTNPNAARRALTHEPLVPRQEITALRELIALAQEGRFVYQPVDEAVPVAHEITTADIVIPPIALLPLGAEETLE